MFKCRYPHCGKPFSDKSDYWHHECNERFPGHQKEEFPLQCKQRAVTPFFHNNLSVWCCPRTKCKMASGKKSNVKWHIQNNCLLKMQQGNKTNKNKVCLICNMTFTQKFSRHHPVLKLYKVEIGNDSSLGSVPSDEQNMLIM